MEKIYSKIHPEELMHIVVRASEIDFGRNDIVPDKNFIQCSSLRLNKGHTFKPHYHIWNHHEISRIAQESWVVIRGSVKCSFYDYNGEGLLAQPILCPGDSSYSLLGGHTYEILEDDTLVYEYKTGPYEGVEKDKIRF